MNAHTELDRTKPVSVPPNLCALAIMTKVPVAGKVKTRLNPPLTPEQAAELNICFLRDISMSILQATKMAPARGVGVYTGGAASAYEDILPGEFLLIPQRGDQFGERLVFAAKDLFSVGFASVCLINSDSPMVSAENFAEAAIELADPRERIVLGPSNDGGYYLIGMKQMHRRLFEDIDWSTERVADQTRKRAAELGLKVYELGVGHDVDDRTALLELSRQLSTRSTTSVAPATREFLQKLKL